ncbi:MAG: nuclear transport factor 2 family protein [Acidimicrobiia bacterium]|nr:nuclear transport factor 2 family protein [Acidimicrobiia bacterium]
MENRRAELSALTATFIEAFNTNDLDTVVGFFSTDGVYEEFNGRSSQGHEAVRAAFAPQFSGAFGDMKFLDEDLFIDAETGKVMVSWRCTLEVKGEPTSWRGLDLLHFQGDKVVRKLTYAKTRVPLFEAAA